MPFPYFWRRTYGNVEQEQKELDRKMDSWVGQHQYMLTIINKYPNIMKCFDFTATYEQYMDKIHQNVREWEYYHAVRKESSKIKEQLEILKDFYWAKIKTELPKGKTAELRLYHTLSPKQRKSLRYALLCLRDLGTKKHSMILKFKIPKPIQKLIVAENVSLIKKLSKPMEIGLKLKLQNEKSWNDYISHSMKISPPPKEINPPPKDPNRKSFFERYFNTHVDKPNNTISQSVKTSLPPKEISQLPIETSPPPKENSPPPPPKNEDNKSFFELYFKSDKKN